MDARLPAIQLFFTGEVQQRACGPGGLAREWREHHAPGAGSVGAGIALVPWVKPFECPSTVIEVAFTGDPVMVLFRKIYESKRPLVVGRALAELHIEHIPAYLLAAGEIAEIPPIASVTPCCAVKAWPGEGRAWGSDGTTASLDRACTRRHRGKAGRDEETVLRSNQETDQKERGKRRSCSGMSLHLAGASTASKPARSRATPSGQMMRYKNRTTRKATDRVEFSTEN